MKKIIAIVLALAMALCLCACSSGSDTTAKLDEISQTLGEMQESLDKLSGAEEAPAGEEPAGAEPAASDTLKIGVLVNQTGWFAVYDYNNALECQCLADMYNAQGGIEIGGARYKIELVAEDGQSDASGIRSAAQLIADQGVQYVIETNDFWVEGALDIFEDNGIMNIMAQNNCSFTTINQDLDYSYSFSNGSMAQYAAGFELLVKDYPDVKSVVYCENDDGSGAEKEKLISGLCEQYGLEYVDAPIIYDAEATDFSAVALQLIATGADAFMGNSSVANTGSILKELRNNGSDMVVCGIVGSNASMLKEACGLDDVSNAFTLGSDLENPEHNTEQFNELYSAFKEEYGEETAASWCGVGVNCLYTLLQAMQDAGTTDVEELRAYLETADTVGSLFGEAQVCGEETYGVKHLIAHPNSATELVDGEVVFGGWFDCYVP